jgi:hypothetical protein
MLSTKIFPTNGCEQKFWFIFRKSSYPIKIAVAFQKTWIMLCYCLITIQPILLMMSWLARTVYLRTTNQKKIFKHVKPITTVATCWYCIQYQKLKNIHALQDRAYDVCLASQPRKVIKWQFKSTGKTCWQRQYHRRWNIVNTIFRTISEGCL